MADLVGELVLVCRAAIFTVRLHKKRLREERMTKKLSRRAFLKSTAAGATGMLAVTLLDKASFPRVVRAASRTLTVGVIPGSPAFHLQDAAKKYMAANPDVDIQV